MNLRSGEKVVKFYRQSKVLLSLYLATFVVLVYFPLSFFKRYDLPASFSKVSFIWALALFLYFFRLCLLWRMNIAALTNKRILVIKHHGLLHKEVTDLPVEKVVNVSYEKRGLLQAVFGFGNLHIKQQNLPEALELKNISSPQVVKEEILSQVSQNVQIMV